MTRRMTHAHVTRTIKRDGGAQAASRNVPEEVPIALTYGGSTHAVMMASPANIEDFAIGFSLSEQIISNKDDIHAMEIIDLEQGIDVQMQLREELQEDYSAKKRSMAGPVGCGLCGIDSIEDVMRDLPKRASDEVKLSHSLIPGALNELSRKQELRAETGAVHAAGFMTGNGDVAMLREDVGRHNALDKLIGALSQSEHDITQGAIIITSRVSVDLIQKTVVAGASILIAVSTPTALAIRTAEQAGLTLIALARRDSFEIYTHPDRIVLEKNTDVA